MNKQILKYIKENNTDEIYKYLEKTNQLNEVLNESVKQGKTELVYLCLDMGANDYLVMLNRGIKYGYTEIVKIGLRFVEYNWINGYDTKAEYYKIVSKNEYFEIGELLDEYYAKNYTKA